MILDVRLMSFYENNLGRMKVEESHVLDSNLISVNYVGNDSLFSTKIALFRIKPCCYVRY